LLNPSSRYAGPSLRILLAAATHRQPSMGKLAPRRVLIADRATGFITC
jgi:hypothetical protein